MRLTGVRIGSFGALGFPRPRTWADKWMDVAHLTKLMVPSGQKIFILRLYVVQLYLVEYSLALTAVVSVLLPTFAIDSAIRTCRYQIVLLCTVITWLLVHPKNTDNSLQSLSSHEKVSQLLSPHVGRKGAPRARHRWID